VPGRAGRTLSAIKRTLVDGGLQIQSLFAAIADEAPGLRGGRIGLKDYGFKLDRLEYVPGVKLSGRLNGTYFSHGYVRVFGSAAAAGRLRLRHGVLRGRLRGHRVRLRIPPELPRIKHVKIKIEFDAGSTRRRTPLAGGGVALPGSG
jgi:hypothetical protein